MISVAKHGSQYRYSTCNHSVYLPCCFIS
jgi:hypothetical protein